MWRGWGRRKSIETIQDKLHTNFEEWASHASWDSDPQKLQYEIDSRHRWLAVRPIPGSSNCGQVFHIYVCAMLNLRLRDVRRRKFFPPGLCSFENRAMLRTCSWATQRKMSWFSPLGALGGCSPQLCVGGLLGPWGRPRTKHRRFPFPGGCV